MKKIGIEVKWALIFIIASLLWMVLEKLVGLHDKYIVQQEIYTNFFAIVAITIYIFALIDKRNRFHGGYMTWKQGFISGTIITLIVTILSPVTQIITSCVITPEFFPNAITSVISSGRMTAVEAEKFFCLRNYILMGLIGTLIMGLITAALVALFVRKKKAENEVV